MNPQSMKRISVWGRALGILMMALGGLSALSGLMAFVIGAVPGIVTVFMGYWLFKSGKDAQEFLDSKSEDSVANLLDNYAKYLFINGIMLIVLLVTFTIAILVFGASAIALFGQW